MSNKIMRVLFLTAFIMLNLAESILAYDYLDPDQERSTEIEKREKEDLFEEKGRKHMKFGGLDQNPALKLRISETLTDMIRTEILSYSSTFLNMDYKMASEGMYEVSGIGLPWEVDFHYKNLTHDPFSLNMEQFQLQFTHLESTSAQVVYTHLPLINKWAYTFDYFYRFCRMDFSGKMRIEASNVWAKNLVTWRSTDKGYLYPQIVDLTVNFGQSHLEVKSEKNRLLNFFYVQTFNYWKYMTMNSMNVFGRSMINKNLPWFTQRVLKDQKIMMSQELPQLEKKAEYNIDWRMTADPSIHSHVIDLSFLFDIGEGNNSCTVHADTHDYFYQDYASKYSQVIMSDRVPNCYLQQLADQGWFSYVISTQFMQQSLGTSGIKINAAYLERAYPWIAEKYGLTQELDLEIDMLKPRILFGPDSGNHVQLKTMINVGVKKHKDMNYLVYDEFMLETEFDMEILQEVVFANFKYIELTKDGENTDRKVPQYNPEDLTEQDYEEFWSYIQNKEIQWLDYLNEEVFGYGVPLPYQNLSFLTSLTFRTHAVIAIVDLFYQNRDSEI